MFALRPRPPPRQYDEELATRLEESTIGCSSSFVTESSSLTDAASFASTSLSASSLSSIASSSSSFTPTLSGYDSSTEYEYGSTPTTKTPPPPYKTLSHRNPIFTFNSCPLRRAMHLSGVLEDVKVVDGAELDFFDDEMSIVGSPLTFTKRRAPSVRLNQPKESALTAALMTTTNTTAGTGRYLQPPPSHLDAFRIPLSATSTMQQKRSHPRKSVPTATTRSHHHHHNLSPSPTNPYQDLMKHALPLRNPSSSSHSAGDSDDAPPPLKAKVYFPYAAHQTPSQSASPRKRAMKLTVRGDATVGDLLGLALWKYWEDKWQPRLPLVDDAGAGGNMWSSSSRASSSRSGTSKSLIDGWSLFKVDKDGYLVFSEEAPDPSDRLELLTVEHTYAIMRTPVFPTPSSTSHHLNNSSNNHRRHTSLPFVSSSSQDRIAFRRPQSLQIGGGAEQPQMKPKIKLRIGLAGSGNHHTDDHVPTTIVLDDPQLEMEFSGSTKMQTVLHKICKERGIDDEQEKEYALLIPDNVRGFRPVQAQQTVSRLGCAELVLVKCRV